MRVDNARWTTWISRYQHPFLRAHYLVVVVVVFRERMQGWVRFSYIPRFASKHARVHRGVGLQASSIMDVQLSFTCCTIILM